MSLVSILLAIDSALVAAMAYIHVPQLDPGWATLIAGVLGFGAVAWQLRRNGIAERAGRIAEAKALAGALVGELWLARGLQAALLDDLRRQFDELESAAPDKQIRVLLVTGFQPRLFQAWLGHLTMLPPAAVWMLSTAYALLEKFSEHKVGVLTVAEWRGRLPKVIDDTRLVLTNLEGARHILLTFIESPEKAAAISDDFIRKNATESRAALGADAPPAN